MPRARLRLCLLQAALLAAHLVAAAGAPKRRPPCPAEGSGRKSGDSKTPANLLFQNNAGTSLSINWVDSSGDEMMMGKLKDQNDFEVDSFSGNVYRVREATTQTLLVEYVAGDEAEQDIDIQACHGLQSAVDADDAEWLQVNGQRDARIAEGCPVDVLVSKEIKGKMRGFHVMCVVQDAAGQLERLCLFADGLDGDLCSHSVELEGGETIDAVARLVIDRVEPKWQRKDVAPMPSIFTASGRKLPDQMTLAEAGVPTYRRALVLVLGGVWSWPGIREGFERPVDSFVHTEPHRLTLRTLSLRPRLFEITSFIADAECDHTLELGGSKVRKSEVTYKDSTQGKRAEDWRVSSTFFLKSAGDEILEALDERVQNLTRVPITHSEDIQVLKYDYNGRYLAHTDYFDPKDYVKHPQTLELTGNGTWNRLLTFFMYFNDVERGGETYFPKHVGASGFKAHTGPCGGYTVKPERRKVIMFYNMHPDGVLDHDSQHGGCNVTKGTKWSANFWFWNVPQRHKKDTAHLRMAEALGSWDEAMDRVEERAVSDFATSLRKEEL